MLFIIATNHWHRAVLGITILGITWHCWTLQYVNHVLYLLNRVLKMLTTEKASDLKIFASHLKESINIPTEPLHACRNRLTTMMMMVMIIILIQSLLAFFY